jgi:pimeloyl-ACP methyl ester carboxylesterase
MGSGESKAHATPLHQAEVNLLEKGKHFFQGNYGVEIVDVPIGGDEKIHTWRSTPAAGCSSSDEPPLVLVHGYGSGVGMWFASLPLLVSRLNRQVLAIDMPGCGLSSRPAWTHGDGLDCDPDVAEEYFVERIEQWRAACGIEKMVLGAHSLGGYVSTVYAEKYPERVERLVLISPAGVPHKPEDFEEKVKDKPWFFRMAGSAWGSGHSPFTYCKYGPGRFLLGKYVKGRFTDEAWIPKPEVLEYTYHNWTQGEQSAGGHMHATLLEPGAFGRKPLCDRIPNMQVPIDFIYGTTDWMDYRAALKIRSDSNHSVMHVDRAGHNVMVDNPMGMSEAIQACLEGTPRHGAYFSGSSFGVEFAPPKPKEIASKD